MGGNCLKNIETRRYTADEYYKIRCRVTDRLESLFPLCRIHVLRAYRNKESYGDMDVLIDSKFLPQNYVEEILEEFGCNDHVKNGNCLSFDYRQFQIDLIATKPEEFNTSKEYYAWSDLGNLLGRIAHSMGLKLGHDGLSYNWRIDTYQFKNEVLLTEFKDILPVLGYSWERYKKGFDTLQDIFEFVVSSPFFNKDIFMLHNRNNAARTRDRKRKTYMEFLKWLETRDDLESYPKAAHKDDWLPFLFSRIKGFEETYQRVKIEWNNAVEYKRKFNGDIVKEYTGLEGKELGVFMQWVKRFEYHDENYAFYEAWVLEHDESEIKERILELFVWYQKYGC